MFDGAWGIPSIGQKMNLAAFNRQFPGQPAQGGGAMAPSPAGSYDQSKANAAAGTSGYSDPSNGLTGQARVDASRGQVFANTEGRGQATMSDPYTQAALDRFKGVASGAVQPYDTTTKNAMLTAASNNNAAAEGSQAQMLQQQAAMNGGSVNDASSQAAMRELAANRQGQNQNALNGINQQANMANFNAANEGSQQLAGIRSNQNAQANQMYLAGAGFRAQDYATRESPGGTMSTGMGMRGNQGYNPSPLPQLTSFQPSSMGQAPSPEQQRGGPSYYAGNGASNYNPTPPGGPTADPSNAGQATNPYMAPGPQGYINNLAGGYDPFSNNPMGLMFGNEPDYGSDAFSN